MSVLASLIVDCAAIIGLYMTFWFAISTLLKRNDIADIAWGLGFVVAAVAMSLRNKDMGSLAALSLTLTSIWGIRLATHIYLRNRDKGEDYRYAKWRHDWGKYFLIRSYFQVFLLQGLLMLMVVSPVIITVGLPHTVSVSPWVAAGLLTWIVGFFFEVVGDWQLASFISEPSSKGKIMDRGLWQYTRHPNYFGEVTQWWGLWLILAATSFPLGYKIYGLIGPLTITTLILFVSGIPLLEKRYAKDEAYQKYAKRTNKFFPWEPKKD